MRLVIWSCLFVFSLIILQEVRCQFYPGVMPTRSDDDDLGLILTILLLARQRNCNINNCQRQSRQTIPIPYPVPFTNGPIITRSRDTDDTTNSYNQEATSEEDTKSFDIKYSPMIVAESEEITD